MRNSVEGKPVSHCLNCATADPMHFTAEVLRPLTGSGWERLGLDSGPKKYTTWRGMCVC